MTDTDDTETAGEPTTDDERTADAEAEDEPADEGSAPLRERVDARRVARVGATVLAVLLMVPFVVYAVPGVVGASHSYVVLSGSMEPTMSPGDAIVVEDVDAANVEEGDVITFRRDEGARPTTHRVVGVSEGADGRAFRTAGDANEAPDRELVAPDEIEGRVMSVAGQPVVFPYVGYVITVAGTQTGFALLFGVPVVLLVGGEIRDLVAAAGTDAAAPEEADEDAPDALDADDAATADHGEDSAASDGPAAATAADAESGAGDDDAESGADEGEPTAEDDEPTADDDPAFTFTTGELLLGLGALGAFFAYSVWVAYVTLSVWAFAVAGAVGATFLLLGSLYLLGGDADDDDAGAGDATDDAGEGAPDDLPPIAALFGDASADRQSADDGDLVFAVDDPLADWSPPEGWDGRDATTPEEIVFGATDENQGEVSHD